MPCIADEVVTNGAAVRMQYDNVADRRLIGGRKGETGGRRAENVVFDENSGKVRAAAVDADTNIAIPVNIVPTETVDSEISYGEVVGLQVESKEYNIGGPVVNDFQLRPVQSGKAKGGMRIVMAL